MRGVGASRLHADYNWCAPQCWMPVNMGQLCGKIAGVAYPAYATWLSEA